MERSEVDEFFHEFHDAVVDENALSEFFAAVNQAMAYCADFV